MVCLGFEPWPQDGRCRQNHGAMVAAPKTESIDTLGTIQNCLA